MHISLVTTLPFLALSVKAFTPCPLLGPVFPKPTNLSNSSIFQTVLNNLTSSLDTIAKIGSTAFGTIPSNVTSFSLGVFDLQSSTPLFEYQHTAPALSAQNLAQGTTTITADSIFRIGSASKLITAYLFLIEVGPEYWSHPVTKYIPELASAARNCLAKAKPVDCIDWTEVTLGALAGHLAGIPRDYSTPAELLSNVGYINFTQYDLPALPASDIPPCGFTPTDPCPAEPYLRGLAAEHPSFAPLTSPAYSNAGYEVLALALEAIKHRSFAEMVQTDLFNPLHMTHSSYYLPQDTADAVAPGGFSISNFNASLGNETPVGGFYSSLTDLMRMGQSILKSTLLPLTTTRQWMKPDTFTSDPSFSVGKPWEIRRATNLTDHTLDLYTKSGDVFMYSSLIVLSPDYDVGVVVLAAGEETTSTVEYLSDTLAASLFPAVGEITRQQAQTDYAGSYVLTNATQASNITLATQPGEPGLVVTEWYNLGVDLLLVLAELQGFTEGIDVRLYPTGLVQRLSNGRQRVSFRAVFESLDTAPDGGVFSADCISWFVVDTLQYGGVGLDEFVFDVVDGTAVTVEPRALRVTLGKE